MWLHAKTHAWLEMLWTLLHKEALFIYKFNTEAHGLSDV